MKPKTIHSRRRGLATAAFRDGLHMAKIKYAMRHSQGVNMQDVVLTTLGKAAIKIRLAVEAYREDLPVRNIIGWDSLPTEPLL